MTFKTLTIIPCFNEAKRLHFDVFQKFAKENPNFYFCFVDDGSKDETFKLLEETCDKVDNFNCIQKEKNEGKAEAIRTGMNKMYVEGKYDFYAYIDADLSVNLEELKRMIELIEKKKELKFAMGIRLARLGANIDRNMKRHYLGRVFATFVSILLKEATYDTQCGAKFIHTSLITKIFEEKFTSKWFFDVEIIFRIKHYFPEVLKNNQALEIPLEKWEEVRGSKLKIKDFLNAPFELLKIRGRYSRK